MDSEAFLPLRTERSLRRRCQSNVRGDNHQCYRKSNMVPKGQSEQGQYRHLRLPSLRSLQVASGPKSRKRKTLRQELFIIDSRSSLKICGDAPFEPTTCYLQLGRAQYSCVRIACVVSRSLYPPR